MSRKILLIQSWTSNAHLSHSSNDEENCFRRVCNNQEFIS